MKTLFCPHDIAAIHWWSRVRLRLRLYNSAIQKSSRFCSDSITKWGHLLFHVPLCPFNTSPSIPGHLDFFYFFFVSFSSSDFFPSFWSDEHRECAAVRLVKTGPLLCVCFKGFATTRQRLDTWTIFMAPFSATKVRPVGTCFFARSNSSTVAAFCLKAYRI